jgi:DNA repair photolyase
MQKYSGHSELWGSFVDVKINAPELIKIDKKYINKSILISSVTDPYQPSENKYKLTRKIDEKINKQLEPFASTPEKRTNTLKQSHENSVRTTLFISPIFPILSDWEEIIKITRLFVDEYWFENLNLYSFVRNNVYDFLRKYSPDLIKNHNQIYFKENDYWKIIEQKIKDFCVKEKIIGRIYFHHK